jgi:putative tricarboxylic transport membrane protein
VGICIAFGLLGWLFKRGDYPTAPIILGLILGPMIEENLRLSLVKGPAIEFFTRPGSLIILILAFLSFFVPYFKMALVKMNRKKTRKKVQRKDYL